MHNIINLKRKRLYKTLLSCMYEAHQNCKQIQYFSLCPIAKISIYVYGRIWKSFNILQVEIQNPPSRKRCGSKRFNTYHSFLLFFSLVTRAPSQHWTPTWPNASQATLGVQSYFSQFCPLIISPPLIWKHLYFLWKLKEKSTVVSLPSVE